MKSSNYAGTTTPVTLKLPKRPSVSLAHVSACVLLLVFALSAKVVWADPESDRKTFQAFFHQKFPQLTAEEFGNGVYAINQDARSQWLSFEEFPPYETDVEQGELLFHQPFHNGNTYSSCFDHEGIAIRQTYPRFDPESGQIVTLESAINACRRANQEADLPYGQGDLIKISAYMAYTSRGMQIDIQIPDDARAINAYEKGKRFYYSKRGQLNMSCAGCHVAGAGKRLRAETTSPALGQTTHFPVYRLKWQEMGSLHRRFAGCNAQIRAKPFDLQSTTYRELEYFLTYMSNGLPLNGPALRK